MAVDSFPPLEGSGDLLTSTQRHIPCTATTHPPSFFLRPLSALFLAIDSQCRLQDMDDEAHAAMAEDDEVVYYVNRDSAGWVEQHVRRHVYLELKLESTRNRTRNEHRARDDWVCLYCKGTFPSKLRLTDHRCGGCPCGPVNSRGITWELPVYPNLKTAKQGKDLKVALQRSDVWENLHDDEVWFTLNPELLDATKPPPGARVQERWFMEETLEILTAQPAASREFSAQRPRPQPRSKAIPPRRQPAPPGTAAFVDLPDDDSDEALPPPPRPKKRKHAEVDDSHRPCHSSRQFRAEPRQQGHVHSRQSVGGDVRPPSSSRAPRPPPAGFRVPPTLPLSVEPIQTRCPSPETGVILAQSSRSVEVPHEDPTPAPPPPVSPSSGPHVQPDAPPVTPPTPVTPVTPRGEHDLAQALRQERQAFYLRAASAARGSVKMDAPKPALRPAIQPPALFYLMACGLLNFDLDHGRYEDFEAQIQEWKSAPGFMDRLYAAFGRFYGPTHQVLTSLYFHALVHS